MKIGLFGIGLDTYWEQFDGLLSKLTDYQNHIASRIEDTGAEVVNAGMIDTPLKAKKAAKLFGVENVDMIVLYISTYALSHNAIPVVQNNRVPVLVLNIQPVKAVDYEAFNSIGDKGVMTGKWLANCQSCVAPELASVFNRVNIPYRLITGYLDEDYVWNEINEWIQALEVKIKMADNRVGVLGHYYNGMMDVYSDLTQQASAFGNHFEILEFGVLKEYRENVTLAEVEAKITQFEEEFNVSKDCSEMEKERAAKTSVALDKLISEKNLGALAYYYEGEGDKSYEDIVTSMIPGLTLLTGHNVPAAGEYEIKNVQAMKIMDLLGAGGSFSEFYAMDFEDDIVLLGHDGPAHFAISQDKVGLVPLPVYHGKPGQGLSIQMKVVSGPVTLLSVCQDNNGKVKLLVAEGESVEGPTLQMGNTNSRYKFPMNVRDFTNQWSLAGPSHHCAIGIGHKASILKKIADLLGVGYVQIC